MIAILADIHGNLHALEAVLADMPKVDQIWSLGDMLSGPPFPCEVLEHLMNMDVPVYSVLGNNDERILTGRKTGFSRKFSADKWVSQHLKPHHVKFLEGLPICLSLDTIRGGALLFHGTPENITGGVRNESDAIIAAKGYSERWLAGGHRHRSAHYSIGAQAFVVSGSVGLSIDGMGGMAAYTLLDETLAEPSVEFRHIPYDVDKAVSAIKNSTLMEVAPGLSRAYILELTNGKFYTMGLMTFAFDLAKKQMGYRPETVPDEIWLQAEREWDGSEWR